MSDADLRAVVGRVRDAIEGESDGLVLFAKVLLAAGWRHSFTVGDLRALLTALDALSEERDQQVAMNVDLVNGAKRAEDAIRSSARAAVLTEVRTLVDSFPSYDLVRGTTYDCACDMKRVTDSWPGEWLDREALREALLTTHRETT